MNILYTLVLNGSILALYAFVSFSFGLSLVGKNPRETFKPLVVLSVIAGLLHAVSNSSWPGDYTFVGFAMLLILGFRRAFKLPYAFAAIAVLLASILFLLHNGIEQSVEKILWLSGIRGSASYASWLGLILYAALGVYVFGRKPAVLSHRMNLRVFEEGSPGSQFLQSVFPTVLALSVMLTWVLYQNHGLVLRGSERSLAVFAFTAAAFVLVLYYIRIYSFFLERKVEEYMDKKHQEELLNFMQVIRSQRHDFNFHLQAIFGLLENGRYEECKAYAKAMVSEASDMNEVLPVHHPAVSALLSTFKEMAVHKGIQLDILIHYNLLHIPCTVNEMNKIIGNLVQNAIDEVELYPKEQRWIQIMILKRGGNSVIKVTNESGKSIESYKNIFNPGYSTKPSHEGIGLTTVQKIAAKYQGAVYPEFEDGKVHFIVQIPNVPQPIEE